MMKIEPPDFLILSCQRSGTHFLQASLASHPNIHGRGEFLLSYARVKAPPKRFILANRPDYLNAGIVMYNQLRLFEVTCGSICNVKIIHLMRNAWDVALSAAQVESDKKLLGQKFRSHYRIFDPSAEHAPISRKRVEEIEIKIRRQQAAVVTCFAMHPDIMTVKYEDLTNDKQVNQITTQIAQDILNFLELDYAPLTNTLRKSGPTCHVFED